MATLRDFSIMDILFDKEDQIKFEKDIVKTENDPYLTNDYWHDTGDNDIDSILFNQNFNFLPNEELLSEDPLDVANSVCSDSGISSDQQFSPESADNSSNEESDTSFKNEMVDIDPTMLSLLEEEIDMDQVTLLPHCEEIVTATTATAPPTKPVVRVKPSLTKSPITPSKTATPAKVIHVTAPSQAAMGSNRSILIPLSVKGSRVHGSNTLRTVKIVSSISRKPITGTGRMKVGIGGRSKAAPERLEEGRSSSEETGDESEINYPRLRLTDEERKLMIKEGVSLPTRYPLSKEEERELKRIRRKIRNKISAQDSRKRKKEYVDGLEDRVKQCSVENANLMKRVKVLQSENQSLTAQLRRLQAVIAKGGGGGSAGTGSIPATSGTTTPTAGGPGSQSQPATCLMVLVLSLALIMAPNMRQGRPVTRSDIGIRDAKTSNSTGQSRGLLEIVKPSVGSNSGFVEPPLDDSTIDEVEVEDDKSALVSDFAGILDFRRQSSEVQYHDHDYTQTLGRKRIRSFVIPPIDDEEDWPPPKVTVREGNTFLSASGSSPLLRRNTTQFIVGSPYRILKEELSSDEGEPM